MFTGAGLGSFLEDGPGRACGDLSLPCCLLSLCFSHHRAHSESGSVLSSPGRVGGAQRAVGASPVAWGGNLHSLPFFQVWVGSSSGLPPLEPLPSDLPSWDFAQPALWRSSHSVPDTAFSLSLKKSFPALENLGPAHSSNALFCPAPPGYLRQGWTTPEGSRAFTQWPVG